MGLLDGVIAKAVRSGLKQAGMYKSATLIKSTAGSRTVGAETSGTNPTTTSYACEGFVTTKLTKVAGTLVEQSDRVVVLLGDSLSVTPATRDRITIESKTQNIVAIDRDPASATYVCLCRG